MRNLLKSLTDNFADSTSLLALATALLLIVLYAGIGHVLLLVAFVPYTLLAALGIFSHQRNTASPEKPKPLDDTITSSPLPKTNIANLATRMSVTVDGLVRASHAINDVTIQQGSSAQEQAEVIGTTNGMLDKFLALSKQISEQARSNSQTWARGRSA